MNLKLFTILITLLIITSFSFAAAPTLSALTASPTALTDHNYSNWKSPKYMTLSTTVTGEDLNADGCGYAIDGSWTYPTATDLNLDTNTYRIIVQAIATDDTNWCITCKNNSDETSEPSCRTLYLDANSPTTTSSFNGINNIVLTATDIATTTGNGSGINAIYYKIDLGDWTSSASSSVSLTVTNPGEHTIYFYSTDNVDNNEMVTIGSARETNFMTVGIASNGQVCGIFWILPLIIAALLVIVILTFMSKIELDAEKIMMLVGIGIAVCIAIVILGSVINSVCAIA